MDRRMERCDAQETASGAAMTFGNRRATVLSPRKAAASGTGTA